MRSCSRSAACVGTIVRFGFAGVADGAAAVWNRFISPHAPSPMAAHAKSAAAHRRRTIPLSRRPANPSTSATRMSGGLVPSQQFNLPRMEHFNPWRRSRLNPAADPNPSILQRLKAHPGGFDRRHHAPWNNHSKVPCKVAPEIQIGGCSGLPHRQNPALNHRQSPDPGQNIVRTFRVFYDGWIAPDASFIASRLRFRGH